MLQGGIYDQAGGGFARYSTDNEWLAPHFEKMLYDNALLLVTICDAFAITRNSYYKKAAEKTIDFLRREMTAPGGGFYAALDADSEGVEGKFYVWSRAEISEVLGDDAAIFCEFFDVSDAGNWEGVNILRTLVTADEFCRSRQLNTAVFEADMEHCLDKLMQIRGRRIRPQTDDKILLGWNALAISALCKAAGVFGNRQYAALAEETFAFLWKNFRVDEPGVEMYHTFKEGVAKYPAFLDDYAYLIQACLHLQELTSSQDYLVKACDLADFVTASFSDADTGYFMFTSASQTDVLVRKKEVYDGATPSGNSIMVRNLAYLGIVFDKPEWCQRAVAITNGLLPAVIKHPNSFAVWASFVLGQVVGVNEIVVAGNEYALKRDELLQQYLPAMILQSAGAEIPGMPLLEGKFSQLSTVFYLCRNYSCQAPTADTALILELAKAAQNLIMGTQ